MNNIKGILFDMDGTVLDSEALFDESQILLLKEYNITTSIGQLEEFKGMSYKDFYPKFINKFNVPDDIELLRLKIRTYLHKLMETNLKFINGFEQFYKSHIKNNPFKVGLVTNTTRVSYQNSQVLKATASFSFDRYICGETSSLARALGIDLNNNRRKSGNNNIRYNDAGALNEVMSGVSLLNDSVGYQRRLDGGTVTGSVDSSQFGRSPFPVFQR